MTWRARLWRALRPGTRVCGRGGRLWLVASLMCSPLAAASEAERVMAPGTRTVLQELGRLSPAVRVGEWVTYGMGPAGGAQQFLRLAVVGEGTDALGREAYWLEVELGHHPSLAAPLAQLRMQVARSVGARAGGISRLFTAWGHGQVREVPPDALARLVEGPPRARPPEPAPAALALRTGESRTLLTHAGSVRATPVELLQAQKVVRRLWASPQIPVLRMARVELPGLGHTLEVHEFGLDARPRMLLPDRNAPTIGGEPRGAR